MNLDPHDVEAERAVVGALLHDPSLLSTMPLDADHFHPRHVPIILALRQAVAEHGTPDVVQVARELAKRDRLTAIGGAVYLADCLEARAMPGSLRWYTSAIEAATIRRKALEIGTRLVQMAQTTPDADDLLDHLASQHVLIGEMVDKGTDSEPPIGGLSEIVEFVDEDDAPHRWVIPGILERQDRAVITAPEGAGKSVLARQLVLLTAAGRHPFLPRYAIPPKRTLLVDLENPPTLLRRGLRGMLGRMHAHGLDLEDRCWRWNEPGGIDVRTAAGYRALDRAMERTMPDLVCIGPVYKMSTSHGDKYEVEAAEVQQAIDRLRQKYGCAFFLEHHAAKGQAGQRSGDPFGSSYWLRWPEFGLSLTPDRSAQDGPEEDREDRYTLGRFRGDRDLRDWPDTLTKGTSPIVPWDARWEHMEAEHRLVRMCEEAFL